MVEMLITKSKVKEVVDGFNVAGDFADELNEVAIAEVKKAGTRAESNGRKTAQAKDVYPGKVSAKVMLVVKSKIKEVLKDMNVSGDFAESLNEVLVRAVKEASQRAEGNGRKTVQARDL